MSYEQLGPAELRHVNNLKWTLYPEGVTPMWIADMDFPVAPAILKALHARLEQTIGYIPLSGDIELTRLLQEKLTTQGLGEVPTEGISYLPGVVPGLFAAVNALAAPGENVVTMTPIYHPFHLAINDLGRKAVCVPLIDGSERWEIDWDALDAACAKSKVLMLCHPHNPTGRVWDAEELNKLRELVLKHDMYVISDELHADLRYTGQPFEAFAADARVRERTVTVTGPCKAFNTAGLGIGALFSHNAELVSKVKTPVAGIMGHPSALSVTMWETALKEGGPWLADTVQYLQANRDFLGEFLRERLPKVKVHPAEATYLAWLDLRAYPQAGDIQKFLIDEAKVAIHNGPIFAPDGVRDQYQGFIRLNFATSRPILTEALERMAQALG